MRGQLIHLVKAASEPHVTLQVIPYTAGAHAGPHVTIDFSHLYHQQITIKGRSGYHPPDREKCFAAAAQGKIKAQIEKLLPLSRAVEAHRLIESGEVTGKIVLDPTLDG